jgi:hypothetical protein
MRPPSLFGVSLAALAVLASLETLLVLNAGGVVAHTRLTAPDAATAAADETSSQITTIEKVRGAGRPAATARIRVVLASPYDSQSQVSMPLMRDGSRLDDTAPLQTVLAQKGDFGGGAGSFATPAESAVAKRSTPDPLGSGLSDLRLASR